MTLGQIIKSYRTEHGLSMDSFSERSGISKAYISLLEKNKHPKTGKVIAPSIQCIKQAADGMGMDFNDLFEMIDGNASLKKETVVDSITTAMHSFNSSEEKKMIDGLSFNLVQLNKNGLKKVSDYTNDLLNISEYRRTSIDNSNILDMQRTILYKHNSALATKMYTYLRKIAAAGVGFYFDDIPTDTIEAPYMEGADFIIGVNGDSMDPTYNDGDLVYVEKRQIVEIGDIGIFLVNGECYIKEAGENELISHNPDYPNIPGTEHIHCIGKVLGKVELN